LNSESDFKEILISFILLTSPFSNDPVHSSLRSDWPTHAQKVVPIFFFAQSSPESLPPMHYPLYETALVVILSQTNLLWQYHEHILSHLGSKKFIAL